LALVIAGLIASNTITALQRNAALNENKILRAHTAEQSAVIETLSKTKTYSISLAPSITNKVTSAFGATKNVTLQYYFTMDGNSISVEPDSIYSIQKQINK
jgi:myo-inositol-hexaphosphate 3-phosphohydrolase